MTTQSMPTTKLRRTKSTPLGIGLALALCLIVPFWASAEQDMPSTGSICHLMTFEGMGTALMPEDVIPGTDPLCIRFVGAGSSWYTLEIGAGSFENPPSGITVGYWSGITAEVHFDFPVASVSLYYGAALADDLTLEAYDAQGVLLASTIGLANNSDFPLAIYSPLEIDRGENIIAKVVLSKSGGGVVIDDLKVCMLAQQAEIDLKPENAENAVDPFNLGSNKPVEVAVFSTPELDATAIKQASVELGDAELDVMLPALGATIEDINGDSLPDILFDFGPAIEFGDAGALNSDSTHVLLTGSTAGGMFIHGTDEITIVGSK